MADRYTLERRIAGFVRQRQRFTADDVTDNGRITIDAYHEPNARQNTIGAIFNSMAASGYIRFTGEVTKSKAPKRKGGMIRVWEGTAKGRAWANQQDLLQEGNQ